MRSLIWYAAFGLAVVSFSAPARADEPAADPEPTKKAPPTAPKVIAPPADFAPSQVPTWEAPEREVSDSGPEASIRLGASIPAGSTDADHKFDPGKVMIPVWADVGFRANKWFFVGVFGQVGLVIPDADHCLPDVSCRRLDFRLGPTVQIHTMPDSSMDLWFGAGAGYEWLKTTISSDSDSISSTAHGLEFINLTAGLLFKLADHNGLGPFLSMSAAKYSTVSGFEIDGAAVHQWFTIGIHGSTFNPL